jgi:hypothetical protein
MNRRSFQRQQRAVGLPRYSGAHPAAVNRDYRFNLLSRHLSEVVNEFVAFGAESFLFITGHPIPIG